MTRRPSRSYPGASAPWSSSTWRRSFAVQAVRRRWSPRDCALGADVGVLPHFPLPRSGQVQPERPRGADPEATPWCHVPGRKRVVRSGVAQVLSVIVMLIQSVSSARRKSLFVIGLGPVVLGTRVGAAVTLGTVWMNVTARVTARGIIYNFGHVDGEWGGIPKVKAGTLDAGSRYGVMSCGVQTYSRSASNPNSATASRDFAMIGTSTSAPRLATSSRRHSTANSRPTSRRRRDNPSPAGDPASSTTAGAPCSTDPMSPPSRRTRVEPRSASPSAGAAPGRPRSPRSSPATSSASSSATPAGRRGSCTRRSQIATTRNQAATRRGRRAGGSAAPSLRPVERAWVGRMRWHRPRRRSPPGGQPAHDPAAAIIPPEEGAAGQPALVVDTVPS